MDLLTRIIVWGLENKWKFSITGLGMVYDIVKSRENRYALWWASA